MKNLVVLFRRKLKNISNDDDDDDVGKSFTSRHFSSNETKQKNYVHFSYQTFIYLKSNNSV